MYPLQNTEGKSGPRILFIDYCMMDFDTVRFTDLLKMFFIMTDILMIADDNIAISGEQLIINFQNIPASFFLQFTPEIFKKMTVCWGTAYPLRIKLCLCINAPLLVEKLYNTVCKPLMSKKIQNRVHVYSSQNMEKAYTHLPKPLFPERFGGHNGSHTTLTMEWKRTVENYRGWVMEDSSYKSNEKLRPNKPKTCNEEFGMEGTFRKLNLD
ncbi:hypothetical protein RI129_004937 [Pyrocoelia pectoralis]|uniref:CRAL-TRIO domain-containing protein n=1 Tax=Pyrocoelia pectoralis TaxID=417401 RepID=A0AAN7VJV0_9COLE